MNALTINNESKYIGKHVVIKSFADRDVLFYGDDRDSVAKKAKEMYDDFIILYIPDRRHY